MDGSTDKLDLQLPGYKIYRILNRSDGRVIYQANRLADGTVVAVETLDTEYPGRHQVAALRREGTIAQRLADVEGVCQVHAILPHGSGNLALITESYASSLKALLVKAGGDGLPLTQVLDIAQRLVRILQGVHDQSLVHKALSPEKVCFDPSTGNIALTGFGIASELDQERQATQVSLHPEGPLPYISPEQTGRMNRDLDYRSDYYSLGVLLFELLTGKRPFEAENHLGWVYNHISCVAPAPHSIRPTVPEILSAIVLKLLEKSPTARYQSAEGLLHDLKRCADAVSAGCEIEPFELGENDVLQKFLIPPGLYGREREVDELLGLFESAVAGGSEFCLVHGYSGVGKSALVNEIDRPLVRERGFLVQGKFDQFQQGETYTAIAVAFRGLVQQLLAEPEAALAKWRQRLLEALGRNGALVLSLVPELELIIGKQPAVSELPPAEERNRLHLVLTAFLGAVAGEGHPVVLFLDDLQWSDAPTLELLRRFVNTRELSHLLLIGAYRSNEIGVGHPLRLMLDSLPATREIHELPIGPLDETAVACLVADALCRPPEETRVLSDMIYAKAQGNPFFTNELLRQLQKLGAIRPEPDGSRWSWDLDAVLWSTVSTDVVEFMVERLRLLKPDTQNVLQLAACIGNTFDLQTLSAIYEQSPEETAIALLPALKQHLVLPLDSDYRFVCGVQFNEAAETTDFNPRYRFQHDRVQQAAYALIDSQHLPHVHLSVGRLMLEHAGDENLAERLIDIVGHLNEGCSLIESGEERLHLADLNLKAGVRARHSSAYETAMGFLQVSESLLPDDPWHSKPSLMKPLAAELQQCAYLTGRAEEAERWIDVMLRHAGTDLERGDILATRTRQYATLGRMEASILSAIQGLATLGIEFTDNPSADDIARERALVDVNLGNRAIADLLDAPLIDDPATHTAMRLLMEIFAAAFLSGSGNLFPYLVLKAVNLSLRHGNSPETAFAYVAYGMLLCGELDEPALGYQYGQVGLAINERMDDATLKTRVIYIYATFVHHWSKHWSSMTPWFRKCIEIGAQSGDMLYLACSAQDSVVWDPCLDLETAHRQHAENLEIVRQCAFQDSLDSGSLFLQQQRNLLGLTDSPDSLDDDTFDESQCLARMHRRQFITGIANYHIYKAELCLLYGDVQRTLEHVIAADQYVRSVMALPQLVRFRIIAFVAWACCYPEMTAAEKAKADARMERDLACMTRWADNCEANFRHLQYLMEAERARLRGRNVAALERYDAAIDAARKSGFLRDEATACERAARHLLALGRRRAAEGYLRGAHRLYDRWGARRKVVLLEREFSVLRELVVAAPVSTDRSSMSDLDLASVMKASREISGEMVLDRLLKTTMDILLENAGGQWGCLVVRREGRLVVEAARLPDGGLSTADLPGHSLIPDVEGNQLPLPVTLVSRVLHSDEPVVLHDAASEGEFVQDPYVLRFQPLSVFCVPICRERFEGALYMENNLSGSVFTEARVEVIRLLAAQASVAIENARLYEQVQDYTRTLEQKVTERTARLEQLNRELQDLADRDGLTGVANRRRGDTYLEESWRRLRRERKPLSVIMLDVDHFKAFNDAYGHQEGDFCLVNVAETVRTQVQRPADLVARYGGEEFMIILPDTDQSGAALLGEKIRHAVELLAIPHVHASTGAVVTVSLGTATMVPDASTAEDLLREADIALYRAKKMGRNQVQPVPVVASLDPP